MDCEEVGQLLDAYSLGAAEPDEAEALEEHVADCVRCWSSLNEAQRTAATLALSTAMEQAPSSLRERILAEAERREDGTLRDKLAGLARRLWPIGAGLVAAGAAASLALALFLNAEVNDLREDNDQLTAQVETADQILSEQRQLMAVLASPDLQQVQLRATDPSSPALGVYHWSDSAGTGALFCNNLPPPEEGQVYRVWLITPDGAHSAGSFQTWKGLGQLTLDPPAGAYAIVMSLDSPDASEPSETLLRASLRR